MKKLFLGLLLLVSMSATARKLYVSSSYTGSTSNGAIATPWKSLANVQSNLGNIGSTDSVLFAKGDKFSGTLTLQSESNVYFGVYGTGADPLFWGNGGTIGAMFILRGCTNVTFYGWNISDTTISFTNRYVEAKIQTVFQFENSSTNNIIRKCTMDRIGYGAYYTTSSGSNTIDSSDIGNLRMIKNTPTSVNPDDDYGGVPVQISSSNNTITNNYFHDCYAASYDYNFDGGGIEFFEEGVVIENNVIAYNTFINGNGTFEFGSSNDGVVNNLIQNNKIYYNKIINNNTVVYINNNGQYKTRVTNLQFYNNVIVQNIPNANPSGSSGIQFSLATADANSGIIVLKNNILYVTNGADIMRSGQFTSGQLTHTNNIFTLSGGSLNFTLDATERSTAIQYWTNTTSSNPLNWDYNLLSTSYAINNGVPIAGLTKDFIGKTVPNPPDIGILEYDSAVAPTACTFIYGSWTTCSNNSQTRTYTASPVGCLGAPPLDSIQRTCPSCTFTYSAWSACNSSNIQTRTYTSSPLGCIGVPPLDSTRRSCSTGACVFTYGTWSTCANNIQTRSFTKSPVGCSGNPPTDSITKACVSPTVSGRKFYFSSSGSDTYSTNQAQNPLTPWKTLAKLNSLSGIALAGDTFAFKRGETFANGTEYGTTGSVKWYGGGYEGRSFPSGTANNPIVFTYYGDMNLERPNLLYPYPSSVKSNEKNVLAFANVSYIVIDGIQFNDTRFPVNDKRSGAFTTAGLWFGDSGYCNDTDGCKCNNITVKNCNFSNIAYGIVSFVRGFTIDNNTFSNFKSTGWLTDTLGNNDIGADPMIISGSKYRITNNRITGSWAYCNPNSSSTGLLGGALETINNFDSSFVAYNTFIDCSGGMEFGTNLPGGVQGPDEDTICYNKFINCSNITFLNTSGQFATQAKNIHFWNNFFVEGSMSRMSGYNAGGDALGDGQTYGNTGFIYWPPYPINKSIRVPSSQNYQNAWRPIASGLTSGQFADTVFDIRNNIFWINNGFYAKYSTSERGKIFYKNNVYHLVSGFRNPQDVTNAYTPTSLGSSSATTLATGEVIRNGDIILDSSSIYPQNWDMHVFDSSYAATGGTNVGLTRDFDGNTVSGTPSIGIYQTGGSSACTSYVYRPWSNCNSGIQTRTYTALPSNCTPTPPTDSIVRTCTTACTFTYGAWGICSNNLQNRTYTFSPIGCTGTPPADSIQRSCTPVSCTFTYSAWSGCQNNIQTRTYTKSPSNCTTVPPTDSIVRSCVSSPLILSLVSASRGTIIVSASGGTSPYYYSINSTSNYTLNRTRFTEIKRNTYSNIRVRDSLGNIVRLRVYMPNYK